MKRLIKILILIFLILFIAVQFFQPEKNSAKITNDHILRQENIPANVQVILKNACLDCHSSTTNYLWFHRVVPVAWMINSHIKDGKDEMNLSEWGQLDDFKKMDLLDEMCDEVEKGKMPLKQYRLIHAKARLNEEEKKALCDWSEKLIQELLKRSAK